MSFALSELSGEEDRARNVVPNVGGALCDDRREHEANGPLQIQVSDVETSGGWDVNPLEISGTHALANWRA